MQKKLNGKLILSKETLRTLTQSQLDDVHGGQTGSLCSNPTFTCNDTCVACFTRFATCSC